MFNISKNGIVTVNRGDSFELPIVLNIGDSMNEVPYSLQGDAVLYIGIMEPNQKFEDAVIRKVFTAEEFEEAGEIYIRFWPEDTINVCPGKYYYQVKLQTTDAKTKRKDVETVIDKTLFYILE